MVDKAQPTMVTSVPRIIYFAMRMDFRILDKNGGLPRHAPDETTDNSVVASAGGDVMEVT